MLNAKPEFSGCVQFKVEFRVNGKMLYQDDYEPRVWTGNPLSYGSIFSNYDTDPSDVDSDWKNVEFTCDDLVQVMPKDGRFIYKQGDIELTLIREQEKTFNWDAF
jgi:hypothetical protein